MRYFLPDWDDRVDPRFDFHFDLAAVGRNPQRDDIYAHEYFGDDQCYDGILVSRSALSPERVQRKEVDRIGLRGFLRLPRRFELMGDCGAFGYVNEPMPIYETPEVLDFYQRVGVDYGVSVDHIIFPAFPDQRQFRYDLTINNAIEFLERHRAGGYTFTPVGAVQGWDVPSYADAARRLAAAGYDMLRSGGSSGRAHARSLRLPRASLPPLAQTYGCTCSESLATRSSRTSHDWASSASTLHRRCGPLGCRPPRTT